MSRSKLNNCPNRSKDSQLSSSFILATAPGKFHLLFSHTVVTLPHFKPLLFLIRENILSAEVIFLLKFSSKYFKVGSQLLFYFVEQYIFSFCCEII
jgi:hypothetical protein